MDQKEIKDLLEEASQPKCSLERRAEIQCKLGEASAAMQDDSTCEIEGKAAGLHLVLMNQLYVETIKNRPEHLPKLFPVFALICGDRGKNLLTADIDWSLL